MAEIAAVYQSIPLEQIRPSPHQTRKAFNEEALKGLAESMRQDVERLATDAAIQVSRGCEHGVPQRLPVESASVHACQEAVVRIGERGA